MHLVLAGMEFSPTQSLPTHVGIQHRLYTSRSTVHVHSRLAWLRSWARPAKTTLRPPLSRAASIPTRSRCASPPPPAPLPDLLFRCITFLFLFSSSLFLARVPQTVAGAVAAAAMIGTPTMPRFRRRWLLRLGPHLPPPFLLVGLNPCFYVVFMLGSLFLFSEAKIVRLDSSARELIVQLWMWG
jgi:hypothetical protein